MVECRKIVIEAKKCQSMEGTKDRRQAITTVSSGKLKADIGKNIAHENNAKQESGSGEK